MTMRQLYRNILLGGGTALGLFLGGLASAQSPVIQNGAEPAAVQESTQPLRNYLRSNVIRLPIEFNPQLRSAIQEIRLYCKEGLDAQWTLREKTDSSADAFTLRLQKDGEYAFTMVTVDKQGRAFPEDLQKESPGLIVIVDTQRPVVELTNLGQSQEGHLIQCEIRDANLDISKTHFAFQCGDKVFRAAEQVRGRPNVFCVPAQAVFTGLVRVTAHDLAGN
jgi:hypothetical protein